MCFSKPLVTPSTMLATSERVSPCSARFSRSSSGRRTRTTLSSRSSFIWRGISWVRVPLGPLTVTMSPSSSSSTPEGSWMGRWPIRDMLLVSSPLPDVGEDLATDARLVGDTIGAQSLRGRDDRDAEAPEDPRQRFLLGIHAQPRLGDAAHAADRPLAVGAVLQVDPQHRADLGLLHCEVRNVALRLEQPGDLHLDLGARHGDLVVVGHVGVAQARQHVRDWVRHRHRATPLPARLGDAGQLAGMGELTHADPAQAELAQDGPGPAAALAARVGPHLELGGALLLRDQRLLCHLLVVTSWPRRFADLAPRGNLRISSGTAATQLVRNGKPSARSSARPWSSVSAVVTRVMSMPRTRSILS